MQYRLMRKRWIVGVLGAVIGAGLGSSPSGTSTQAPDLSPKLVLFIVNYAAEHTCACLFVSNRLLESCNTDLDPAAKSFVSLKVDGFRVTATVSSLVGHARYTPGFGCAVDN